jgi:C4-type Zn-finger protein
MSTNCAFCGYRDNEVKSGSAISDQGKRITIICEDREDLSRDILKVGRSSMDSKYASTDNGGFIE